MPENGFDESKTGLSIASLVLGIITVVLTFTGVGIITGVISIILGGFSIYKKLGSKKMAIAGILLSILSLVCLIAVIVLMMAPWYYLAQ